MGVIVRIFLFSGSRFQVSMGCLVRFWAETIGFYRFYSDFSEGVRIFSGKGLKKSFCFCFFMPKDLHSFTRMFTGRAVCAKYSAKFAKSSEKQHKVRVGEDLFSIVNIFKNFYIDKRSVW